MMKFKFILLALAIAASANLKAQNVTKAELDALSQRVAKLETDLERVITENVNLVEQLKIKTITSYTDKNKIQWDIVKVEPDVSTGDVALLLRLTNNSGVLQNLSMGITVGVAVDSDSNRENNVYKVVRPSGNADLSKFAPGVPVNIRVVVKGVPLTSSYMAVTKISYGFGSREVEVKFTGIHIPW